MSIILLSAYDLVFTHVYILNFDKCVTFTLTPVQHLTLKINKET